MRRIAIGSVGVAVLGAALFSAPMLWSQSTREQKSDLPTKNTPWWQMGQSGPERQDDRDFRDPRDFHDFGDPGGFGRPEGGPDGFMGPGRGPGGPGGPGGPMGRDRQLVDEFDADGDGILNLKERTAARETIALGGGNRGPGGRGFGPPGGPGGHGNREPAQPGPSVSPSDVENCPDASLYEPTVLRTLFLEFENEDWEEELAAFKGSDVEVPATLTVDGKAYPNVGVHFRGMSSYMMVPAGYKRSLNLSLDYVDSEQRLYGYKTLNLLNCSGDSSLLSTVLYSHIARQYFPAPKANFVKVVINGESWGIYCNVQQFNKEFLAENYPSDEGARWKVPGNPGADGGLRYLGENIDDYRRRFEIKSKDKEQSWKDLIHLCRVLNETPTDQLEQAIAPILDIDTTLWFLALDVVLVNSDGYWTRSSDYYLFHEAGGKFYIALHDMNEAFHGAGGPGGFGPPGGPGGPHEFSGDFGPQGGPGMPGGFAGSFGPPSFAPLGERDIPDRFEPPSDQRLAADTPNGMPADRRADAAPDRQPEPDARSAGDRDPREFSRGFGRRGRGRGGPGGGGPGHGGIDLDPLVALDDPGKPLRSKLLQVPRLRQKYLQYIRIIAEKSLDWNELGPVVAGYRDLIEKEVEADTRKLSTLDAFLQATDDSVSKDGAGTGLRGFAEKRREFLLKHAEIAALPREIASELPEPKAVSLPEATLPEEASQSPVVINEFLAGSSKRKTADGGGSDWIELFNPSTRQVDLSGMNLSDSRQNIHKWSFPDGTIVPPNGYVLVWADDAKGTAPGLHATFKLSKRGEEIILTAQEDGQECLVDHVHFEKQTDDVSHGRYPDGTDNWQPLVPSPEQPNRAAE